MAAWVTYAEGRSHRIPRPAGPPQCHTAGPDGDRVLIVGSGPAVGWGVHTHDLALPGALARAMTARTGRAVTVDLIADSDMRLSDLPGHLREAKLWRYDAIVVCIGANEALHLANPRHWRRDYAAVIDVIRSSDTGAVLVAAGIPPIRSIDIFDSVLGSVAAAHADRLNDITAALCADDPRACFVPIEARSGRSRIDRHRSPGEYVRWATVLCAGIVPMLPCGPRRPGGRYSAATDTPGPGEAAPRHVAAPMVDDPMAARLQYIVDRARDAFDTDSAHITVLDRDALLHLASAGSSFPATARADRFCSRAILSTTATVIGDAMHDDWAREPAATADGELPRFFAAFPIESATGQTIGVLSVVDAAPRPAAEFDIGLLRELAIQVQVELWQDDHRGVARSA
ncbi:GDSL-type esterase/lipase family protein [Marisediminicola senii]|uniref:GDSL-type esterase/lipase family protein n=1 Tax=Marisediminicola senii TaxID=2711233 RepID=UPI0013EBE936|nr:GDSL-type esterase/lipase family protein [Marisediminicola senii]